MSSGLGTEFSIPVILRMRFSIIARRLVALVYSSLMRDAIFVVLVAGDGMRVAGHARNGARGDAAFGDE